MLRQFRFQYVGVWILNWTPLYIRVQLTISKLISELRRTFRNVTLYHDF